MRKMCAFVLFLMLTTASMVWGDVIYLKSGNKVQGKIIEQQEESVKINTQGTTLTFYKDEIGKIEQSPVAEIPAASSAPMPTVPVTTGPVTAPDQVDKVGVETQIEEKPAPASSPETPAVGTDVNLSDLEAAEDLGAPAEGTLKGQPFVPDRVEIQDDIIAFKQNDDSAVYIFLFLAKGETLEKKKFTVTPETGFKSPHIHLKWPAGEGKDNNTEALVSGYKLELQFLSFNEENGRLKGKISIELPNQYQTKLEGSFEAQIL